MDATEAKVTLAVDVMGSDHGPKEVIAGISQSLEVSPRGTRFLLFGQEEVIEKHASMFENIDSFEFLNIELHLSLGSQLYIGIG